MVDEQRWGAAATGNSPAVGGSNAGCSRRRPPQPPGRGGEQPCGAGPSTVVPAALREAAEGR